jgi:hypothetical protein
MAWLWATDIREAVEVPPRQSDAVHSKLDEQRRQRIDCRHHRNLRSQYFQAIDRCLLRELRHQGFAFYSKLCLERRLQ